jgi:beta-ureidopropionase / N-carbamoyl-L-amino-acid hydrolase
MNRREFNRVLLAALATPAFRLRGQPKLRINSDRLNGHLKALSEFGKNPQGGVSRVAYSDSDLRGRRYAIGLMRDAGLDLRIDAAGNIIGRRAASVAGLKPIAIGSHIDSVPEGGNYDGDVGSLGAIEVVQTLKEHSRTTRHPIWVVIFENEEGGTIGSMALSEGLSEKQLGLKSNSGKTIRDGIKFIGGDPDNIGVARMRRGDLAAYLELHIEQGGVLESEKVDIGVVEGIVGIREWDVTVTGFANHAGTTPMDQRHDAMVAAARLVDAVNRIVLSLPGRQVGTVGKIQAFPGAYNVIPGKVVLGLEFRDLDASKIEMLFNRAVEASDRIAKDTGTRFDFVETNSIIPAPTDQRLRRIIDSAARDLGLSTRVMPSGAGHDAQEMARICPAGMIFIPSVEGISHSPKEFSRPEDIANGANVLLQSLLKLDDMDELN